MGLTDDPFVHYSISSDQVEKLLIIWNHYYPKDEPTFTDINKIYLNKKYPEVSPYQLLFVLADKVFKKYWLDRFYIQGFQLRSVEFVDLLYNKFQEVLDPTLVVKQPKFSDEDDTETPEKKKPTKKVVEKKPATKKK